MKYYSGKGDNGKTDVAGKRVDKDSNIIEFIGALDELNSFIGYAVSDTKYEDIKTMQKSFGKPIGLAARLAAGKRIFEIHVDKANLIAAKDAAFKMGKKLGIQTRVVVV